MKYFLEIASIAIQSESIKQKHDFFLRNTQSMPDPWRPSISIEAPDPGRNLSANVRASKLLGKGLNGALYYQFRRSFYDDASQDDHIDITFNPSKLDYAALIDQVLLGYAFSFDAYYAIIGDEKFIHMDFDKERELRIDRRSAIFRISPVNYFRKDLCMRALGLTPAQIVDRLQGNVETAREVRDGVFIVLTSDVLPTEEMDALCWTAKSHLQTSRQR